jgi:predicted nucleic acid-binding protein
MRLFLDTNVFVASLTDEPGRGEFATRLLNRTDEYELHTSLLNLMEIRTVLTKKKEIDLAAANDAIDEIVYDAELTIPDASDVMNANELQNETLLYPMDAIVASLADGVEAELVTFDSEMLDHVGHSPEEILEELNDSP